MSETVADGCRELASVSERIVAADPEISPRNYLRALGKLVAGIDLGIEGVADLARGGSNEISGRGFAPEFDDGSAGQARHFAGAAASVAIFGSRATELFAHTIVDRADTPDGRLSSAAVEFATQLLDGALSPPEAADWIRQEICLQPAVEAAIRVNPDPAS